MYKISPITPNPYMSTKNPSARKLLRQFTEALYVKNKSSVLRFSEDKANHKETKKAMNCGHTLKRAMVILPLTLYSTSSSDCAITNRK